MPKSDERKPLLCIDDLTTHGLVLFSAFINGAVNNSPKQPVKQAVSDFLIHLENRAVVANAREREFITPEALEKISPPWDVTE